MLRMSLLLFGFRCGGLDEGGCPLDLAGAVGERCRDEGQECGEWSLCDPCTSDQADCVLLRCTEGAWQEVEPPAECAGG